MSVPKSKRSKSSVEFEMIYFTLADGVDNLIENSFYVSDELALKNKMFIENRSRALSALTDELLFHIKVANSIYPVCNTEYEYRRLHIENAIGICFDILTQYTRIMTRLHINDTKYINHIESVTRMINSLKAWRKSDNRFKNNIKS